MPERVSIGRMTELKITTALMMLGKSVVAHLDVRRWDIGIDHNGKLIKIQCKTARLRDGCITFNLTSRGRNGHVGYKHTVDFFGVYCPAIDKCYLIPCSQISANLEMRLRIAPSKNNQKKNTIDARPYELHPSLDIDSTT